MLLLLHHVIFLHLFIFMLLHKQSFGLMSTMGATFVRKTARSLCSSAIQPVHSQGRVSAAISANVQSTTPLCGMPISPPKGTRDFYPEDFRIKSWLHGKWRETSNQFGFEEYDAPVVESEQLYIRKGGEEITQQLYNFVDKGGRRLSLRPEMTPSLARMVLAKGKAVQYPLKWFSVPQCWRYERMTRGRRREHYQWNMDIWGVQGVGAEAELLAAVVACFQSLGLSHEHVGVKISNRKILNALMLKAGIDESQWLSVCVLVDKLDKQTAASLAPDFAALGLGPDTVDTLLSYLQVIRKLSVDHLFSKLKTVDEFGALLGADCEGVTEVRRLLQLLEEGYGISQEWVQFDCSVVRGLAYYTGTVFEGFDKKGQLRAICGGGRYDQLLSSLGAAQSVPAVGFGFGDAVITELLESLDLMPQLDGPAAPPTADVVVYAMDESLRGRALALATQMRQDSLRVDVVLDERKPKWALQRADRTRAPVLLMLAGEEHDRGEVVVKNLKMRTQVTVPYKDFMSTVKSTLHL